MLKENQYLVGLPNIDWLQEMFDKYLSQGVRKPHNYPIEESGVEFEWIDNEKIKDLTVDIDLINKTAYQHILYYDSGSWFESNYDLSNPEEWMRLRNYLLEHFPN